MEQYAQMKASGVNWILDIPSTWNVRVLFQLADQVKNKNKDLSEQNLLSLSYGRIKRKDINNPEGLLPESFDGYNIIEANDIVLRLTDLQNDHTSLRVGQAKERGIITSAYTTLRPSGLINPQYLYYVLHAYDLIKGFYGMGAGVRQGLNFDEVKTIKVPFPILTEQQAIVAYLDDQVSQIDSIIEEATGSIEEYKRWKASTIFEAVTKGITSDNEFKNRNVEWIGNVPKGWKITTLKHLCSMQAGKNLTTEQILDEGMFPVYGGNGIRGYYNSYNNEGDFVLVGRQGALCGNAHLVHGKFWATEHAVVTTCKDNTDIDYLYYLLIGMNLNQYASNAAAQPGLSVGTILNVKTVLPPMVEQISIAALLNQRCKAIDELIEEKEALVLDLEMYKRSIIYEAVTGKRKVV